MTREPKTRPSGRFAALLLAVGVLAGWGLAQGGLGAARAAMFAKKTSAQKKPIAIGQKFTILLERKDKQDDFNPIKNDMTTAECTLDGNPVGHWKCYDSKLSKNKRHVVLYFEPDLRSKEKKDRGGSGTLDITLVDGMPTEPDTVDPIPVVIVDTVPCP